jgi:hypothetical protein
MQNLWKMINDFYLSLASTLGICSRQVDGTKNSYLLVVSGVSILLQRVSEKEFMWWTCCGGEKLFTCHGHNHHHIIGGKRVIITIQQLSA